MLLCTAAACAYVGFVDRTHFVQPIAFSEMSHICGCGGLYPIVTLICLKTLKMGIQEFWDVGFCRWIVANDLEDRSALTFGIKQLKSNFLALFEPQDEGSAARQTTGLFYYPKILSYQKF